MGLRFWQYRLQVGWLGRFISYLYVAVILLAIADLTKRIGQADILGEHGLGLTLPAFLPISDLLYYVGNSVESYFPLILGSALAFAGAKNPSSATVWATIATWSGYIGATTALSRYGATAAGVSAGIDLGVGGGVLVGLLTAFLWTSFYDQKMRPWARMFNGVPTVVIMCATGGLVLGIFVGVLYQLLYILLGGGIGFLFTYLPAELAALLYGLLKPISEVLGLDTLINQVPFYEYGSCQGINGDVMHGNFNCFVNYGEQTEGQRALFLAGGYPVVAFGITTLFIVLWFQLEKTERVYWTILYYCVALSALIGGSWKPALYLLAAAAWPLLLATSLFSGLSYAAAAAFQVTIGYVGGAGMIDLARWSSAGRGMTTLLVLGLVFCAVFAALAALCGQKKAKWLRLAGFNKMRLPEPLMGVALMTSPTSSRRSRRERITGNTSAKSNGKQEPEAPPMPQIQR